MSYPVYLDYNATTPLDPGVIAEITKSLKDSWGNPSSSYAVGQTARSVIENARTQIAQMLKGNRENVIFMSGGTEANNVAIISAITDRQLPDGTKPHVITSNVEHDSVIKILKYWNEVGKIELSIVGVNQQTGCVSANDIISEIKDNTCLISVMHANNETGIIMPISEIAQQLTTINENRCIIKAGLPRIYFHTDSAQTIGKIPVDVLHLNVDYLTIVGHKFYGPRIGALYVKDVQTTPLVPLQYGGGQERGFRAGTENTPMIAGLGYAASLVTDNILEYNRSMKLSRATFQEKLEAGIPNVKVNFPIGERLPNTLSLCLAPGLLASAVLKKCENKIFASVGAACHSNVNKPSSILLASGLSAEEASRTLRLSVGRTTNVEEIDLAVEALISACKMCESP